MSKQRKKFTFKQVVEKFHNIEVIGDEGNISKALDKIENRNFNEDEPWITDGLVRCFEECGCTIIELIEDEDGDTQSVDYFDERNMED